MDGHFFFTTLLKQIYFVGISNDLTFDHKGHLRLRLETTVVGKKMV